MERLIQIKNIAEDLEKKLNDPVLRLSITDEYRILKNRVVEERNNLQKKINNGLSNSIEEEYIIFALKDCIEYTLDQVKVNAKPSDEMAFYVSDLLSKINTVLMSIKK